MAKKNDNKITGKPTATVTNLTLERSTTSGSRWMQAKWKIPSTLKNEKYKTRATSLQYEWRIQVYTGKKWVYLNYSGSCNLETTAKSINIADLPKAGVPNWIAKNRNAVRTDFHPHVNRRYIKDVRFRIRGVNNKGAGKWATITKSFNFPRKPSIGTITHTADTGKITAPITTTVKQDMREWKNTTVDIYICDSRKNTGDKFYKRYTLTSTSTSVSYDPGSRFALKVGQYIRITFKAKAHGYREGGNTTDHVATKYHVVGYPAKPTYTTKDSKGKALTNPAVTSLNADGKVIVYIKTNYNDKKAPVDHVILEALKNTDASTATEAIAATDSSWEEVGVADNKYCTALCADVGDLMPEVGKKTWVRVKAWHDIKEVYYVNSAPKRLTKLERKSPTAADDACVVGVEFDSQDGSAVAEVKWDKGNDDSTGTEVSWSDYSNAWRSTNQPNTFEIPDSWGWATTLPSDPDGWLKTATLYISDLKSSELYVRARRYLESNSEKEYGPYSPQVSPIPKSKKSSVVLSAPRAVAQNSDATFAWALDASGQQESWVLQTDGGRQLGGGEDPYTTQVIPWERISALVEEATLSAGLISGDSGSSGDEDYDPLVLDPAPATASKIVITCKTSDNLIVPTGATGATGAVGSTGGDVPGTAENIQFTKGVAETVSFTIDGASGYLDYDGSATIEYSIPEGHSMEVVYEPTGASNSFAVRAGAMVGGETVWSDYSNVSVSRRPVGSVTCDQTLTAQPLTITLGTDNPSSRALVRVSADMVVGSMPSGYIEQVEGDTIGNYSVQPEWEAGGTLGYTASVELPSGLEFYDECRYAVEAQLEDTTNGLVSDVVDASFKIQWGHQAPIPSEDITITPQTVTDSDGRITRRASIYLAAPTPASQGDDVAASDRYDVYRLVHGQPVLVASDIASGTTIVDDFAPFGVGEQAYRVACKTADGDVAWDDFYYSLHCDKLRFDFGGQYIECPYNIAIKDSYTKDFEAVKHLDGSIVGSWNSAVSRTASLETSLLKFTEPEQIALVKALALEAAPVLVRTPDGDCYAANVTVSNLDRSAGSSLVAVSFNAEEVGLTREYMPVVENDDSGEESNS